MRAPAMAPLMRGGGGGGDQTHHHHTQQQQQQYQEQSERWSHFDNSVSAISFGFVATAILISMFLFMAVFERFLRSRSSFLSSSDHGGDDAGPRGRNYSAKLDYPSPKMSIYSKGVSVLMPGNNVPTYIAHPAPAPCPPERISWPPHVQIPIGDSSSNSS